MTTTYIVALVNDGSDSSQTLVPCITNGILTSTNSSTLPSFVTSPFATTGNGYQYPANLTNTAPPAGYLGQRISSFVGAGSAVSVSSGTATNVTSISLTAGVWDVSCVVGVQNVLAGTSLSGSISTTSATNGTSGDNMVVIGLLALSSAQMMTIPAYRLLLASTTTVYLVANATFTLGSVSAFGRISGVRVG